MNWRLNKTAQNLKHTCAMASTKESILWCFVSKSLYDQKWEWNINTPGSLDPNIAEGKSKTYSTAKKACMKALRKLLYEIIEETF